MTARAVAAAAVLLSAAPAFAQAPPKPSDIPVESFFRRAQFAEMALSPDGHKLAALTPLKGRDNLVVVDLDKRTRNVITDFEKLDAYDIYWVNDRRLCLRVADGKEATGEPRGRGSYCINADGSALRRVNLSPVARTREGSDDLIVAMTGRSGRSLDLYRLNTLTQRDTLLTEDSPGNVLQWVLDRGLVPRIAVSAPEREDKTQPRRYVVWYRDGEGAKWRKLWEYGLRSGEPAYHPIAFDYDNETLYVWSDAGRDKAAIYAYDTKAGKLGNLLVEHPLIDVKGGLMFSVVEQKLVGVRLEADKPITVWTDPEHARVQRSIDAALPGTVNVLSFAPDNRKRVLVYSYSDVDPGTYHLYDDEKKSLETLMRTREWLDPKLMAERRFITYKARDGLEIPAWVTMPRGGGKNLPLVVHVHGGPWTRGYTWTAWGRWPTAQFLASRGYVVLEPEPRGSTGWGRKHYRSSFKQWGLAMQDDITVGALHLVSEGIVDKDRMCLMGSSYGGYATLEGLVKDPDLWRCGVASLAPSDLGLMQEVVYSDTARFSDYYETDFKRVVGDKDADRKQFDETSPARNAARIKAPVLLAMGTNDVRVPLVHGETMKAAMDKAGKPIEYVEYVGEGHGFNKDENVFDFYHRVEKFLAENLKK